MNQLLGWLIYWEFTVYIKIYTLILHLCLRMRVSLKVNEIINL